MVDLATMREAVRDLGGDPTKVNPLAPAELVIDHSVIADVFGRADAFERNVELEYGRNKERYQFLRWGQTAFNEFKVVPPGTGIVHQVNIEHLARVVMARDGQALPGHRRRHRLAHHDGQRPRRARLGRRRHRGRGRHARPAGLDADPAGRRLQATGELPDGTTATDLVLTITEMLRKHGVVGKFVEFYGAGVAAVPLANRATIGNMSPEFGSTCAIFPIDDETIRYLKLTGRAGRAGRAGRGVRQGAGPVARPGRRAGLLRVPRAGPVHGRAVDRRPEAPAGPGRAGRREGRVPRPCCRTTSPTTASTRTSRGELPGLRPAGRPTRAPTARRPHKPTPVHRRPTARRSSSTTAPS